MSTPAGPAAGRRIGALACVIIVAVFLLRFNALGGSLYGFDDDHFLSLARVTQLLAGEWPLRDYADASLQGAWPPLAYLPSAGVQLVLGRNLLSEALLVTGAVALAAGLTFVVAARLGLPLLLALAAALLPVLPSLRLYGWTRPLLFVLCALVLHRYAERSTLRRLAALSALLAVTFLVRHDYALYVAPGMLVAVVARHWREPRLALRHAVIWGALTAVLLAPSLASVQAFTGVRAYYEGIAALVESERLRTAEGGPPSVDWQHVDAEQNPVAWLYWMYFAVPPLAAVVAVWRRRRGAHAPAESELATVLGLATTSWLACDYLLRNNLDARIADPAVLPALLGAWLLGVIYARPWASRRPLRAAVAAAATVFAGVTFVAAAQIGSFVSELRSARFHEGPLDLIAQTVRVAGELRAAPAALWREPYPADGPLQAAAYLHACTNESDRILNVRYSTEAVVLSGRRFAAARTNFLPGHYATEQEQRRVIALASAQVIPIVLTEESELASEFGEEFPIVDAYLKERYVDAGAINYPDREYARVLVWRGLQPVRTFGDTGLPCFR